MQISQKLLDEFKTLMKKRGREYKSDDVARGEAQSLANYVEFVYEFAKKDLRRKNKLKESPKGFQIDEDGYFNCFICYTTISRINGWYDKYGFKCLNCQRAVDKKLIPKEALKNRDSWFANWQINSDFGIHPSTRRKLRREGLLKGRDLKQDDGTIYCTVYIVKENEEFLKKYPIKPEMRIEFVNEKKGREQT